MQKTIHTSRKQYTSSSSPEIGFPVCFAGNRPGVDYGTNCHSIYVVTSAPNRLAGKKIADIAADTPA